MTDNALTAGLTTDEILYLSLSAATAVQAEELAPSNVAQRYYEVLSAKFDQLEAHRPAIARFFATTMQAASQSGSFHTDPMRAVYDVVVVRSTDAPVKPNEVNGLSHLLYALYLLCVMFWLYDRTPGQQATRHLIELMREMIRILRPMMIMPLFSKALNKMTHIMDMIFLKATDQPETR